MHLLGVSLKKKEAEERRKNAGNQDLVIEGTKASEGVSADLQQHLVTLASGKANFEQAAATERAALIGNVREQMGTTTGSLEGRLKESQTSQRDQLAAWEHGVTENLDAQGGQLSAFKEALRRGAGTVEGSAGDLERELRSLAAKAQELNASVARGFAAVQDALGSVEVNRVSNEKELREALRKRSARLPNSCEFLWPKKRLTVSG